jgi:hypothetical protein
MAGPIGDIISGLAGLVIVKKGVDMIAGSESSDKGSDSSDGGSDDKGDD